MRIIRNIVIFLLLLALLGGGIWLINARQNETVVLTAYQYAHPEIPKGFDDYRILVISDLHEAPFAEQIIAHIERVQPDLIAITGDMVQLPDTSIEETLKIVRAAEGIPTYVVTGNHDTQCGAYDEIIGALWDNGAIPLDNDSVCLESGKDTMLLLGIRDPKSDRLSEEQYEEIREQIASEFPDGPCFSILLSHRADLYPEIKDAGPDLILSGHLHGGVVRLPFVGGLVGQDEENPFFPEYDYGLFEEEGAASMIVSGGCDKNPEKKRFWNPPEVVLVTLKAEA